MKKKHSQEMDSLMSMMHSHINRATNSAISDRVIPEIQNIMGTLSLGQRDIESSLCINNQDNSEATSGLKTKTTKKESRSTFDLRDTGDLSPYKCVDSQ